MSQTTSVLLVDSNQELAASLEAGLSSAGYQCECVASAEAALQVMERRVVDVIVAELALPGIDGLELTRRAKRLNHQVAVVIMAPRAGDLPYDAAIESGITDFIVKPFSPFELVLRIRQVAQQEKLRVYSLTDELTGLYNRRGFFTLAEQQLRLARREHKGVYMLYADVNHLKHVNDTFGHQEGDRVLVEVARILKGTYRQSDIVARIGGDEFVVIPIGSNGDNITVVVERLRKSLKEYSATGGLKHELSLSLGVAYYDPAHPCSIDELLAQADRKMYEDKKASSDT